MKYVDGFVLTVPKKNRRVYKQMASAMAKVCKKYGALEYKECRGVTMHPKKTPGMDYLPFPKLTKVKRGEEVWFSYIVYKSKAHQKAVTAKIMKDPIMNNPKWKDMPMPFDMKRMAYGGFTVEVEA